jgi:hypothetical protein
MQFDKAFTAFGSVIHIYRQLFSGQHQRNDSVSDVVFHPDGLVATIGYGAYARVGSLE